MRECKNNINPISDLLLERTSLIQLILVAVFIGFSVSLIVSSITLLHGFRPVIGIIVGLIICLSTLLYIFTTILKNLKTSKIINGFIYYNNDKNILIDVPRYEYSSEINEFLQRAFIESKDLKYIWEREPLSVFNDEDYENVPRSSDLIIEATEYFILDRISMHMQSYFHGLNIKDKNIYTFTPEQIPDVLLKNRFFMVFSKSLNERADFAEAAIENDENEEWYLCISENGTMFKKFELFLPRKAKLRRVNKKAIEIQTNRFSMIITIDFDGTNTFIPHNFEKYYLRLNNIFEANLFNISIKLDIKFKFKSLFLPSGWVYYKWVDSLIETMEELISEENFLESINWKTTSTILQCTDPDCIPINRMEQNE
ncbi:hypothetical protein [Clostridium estertheticum]|uniref:hypothetical protein n=1 Tax=Clostridium estertheticum TaxID=238834 RepID=UPI001CF56F66|nr:hypothetical protein [Clostridium estertheticum]MCB2361965.1 hypothetical protein [Clostridium estertheticum]